MFTLISDGPPLATHSAFNPCSLGGFPGKSMLPVRLQITFFISWGMFHMNVINALVRRAAGYLNDPIGFLRDSMTAGAAGLYFGILTLIVIAFIIGFAGVTVYPIHLGREIGPTIPSIFQTLAPYILLSFVAVYFLTKSLSRHLGGEPGEISGFVRQMADGRLTLDREAVKEEKAIRKAMREMEERQ